MRSFGPSARRLALVATSAALLTSGCTGSEAYHNTFGVGWPHPVTDKGQTMYNIWLGTVVAGAVIGILIWGAILYAVVVFRKKSDELPRQVRYNLPIEVLYTVVPFVIVAVLFWYTAKGENDVNTLTKNPQVTIGVVGEQWNWQFIHEADKVQVTGTPSTPATLVLPVGEKIRFIETSPDVIHSFYVPAFLFKRDVIPGRMNQFELTIMKTGTFTGRCAEFCGEKHDRMNFVVKAVSPADYRTYIAQLQKDPDAATNGNVGAIPTGQD